MTDIEWGPAIEVNGVRPDWLRDEERPMQYQTSAGSDWYNMTWTWGFGVVGNAIRLPATHAYYLATSRGFTYWPGGDSAPANYGDGILFANGEEDAGGGWSWGLDGDGKQRGHCIIGYRKRTEQPAIATELVERIIKLLRNRPHDPEAQSILEILEPDPDLTLAKSIMGDAEAIALAIKSARENGRG